MSLLNIDEDNFSHWDIILNFLRKFLIKYHYERDVIKNYNYRIYPGNVSEKNNLCVYYSFDKTRKEVEFYFDKKARNGLYLDKPNGKRLHLLYGRVGPSGYQVINYKRLIELIYESA